MGQAPGSRFQITERLSLSGQLHLHHMLYFAHPLLYLGMHFGEAHSPFGIFPQWVEVTAMTDEYKKKLRHQAVQIGKKMIATHPPLLGVAQQQRCPSWMTPGGEVLGGPEISAKEKKK